MKTNHVDSCVIAVPSKAYKGIAVPDAIKKYNKMSGPDFNKQLETKDKITFERSEIVLKLAGAAKKIIRTIAPFTRFDKWYGKPAKKSLMGSLIYTELDGYPIAEYCVIRNKNPDEIKIAEDVANYYKKHGWEARVYQKDGVVLFPKFKLDEKFSLELQSSVILEILKILGMVRK